MKGLLVPIFAFSALKLIFTLIITFNSLAIEMVVFLIVLLLINIHLLISCILGKDLLPNSLKRILHKKKECLNDNKK